MPRRRRKKKVLTPEELKQAFENWRDEVEILEEQIRQETEEERQRLVDEGVEDPQVEPRTRKRCEYEHILIMKGLVEELNLTELKDIDKDLFRKVEPFLEEFQKIGSIFKVKKCKKFKKPLGQLPLRIAFYCSKFSFLFLYSFFIFFKNFSFNFCFKN